MTILKSLEMVGIASLLTAGLSLPAAAQSAHTALKDKSGKDVGVVELTQTPGGVLIKNVEGDVLGAVGISGDTSDRDEVCAVAGIEAAGLKAQAGAS